MELEPEWTFIGRRFREVPRDFFHELGYHLGRRELCEDVQAENATCRENSLLSSM